MDNSKEEMQKRLTELKKELARKQRKLERSRRVARIRAHIRQKVNELNEKEQQADLQELKTLEENIPLQTSFPFGASTFSDDICQLTATKLVSNINADNLPILSATDTWLDAKTNLKDSNVDANVMQKKSATFKEKKMTESINEAATQLPTSSHCAALDSRIEEKAFIITTGFNISTGSKIINRTERKISALESTNSPTEDHIQVTTLLDFNKVKGKKKEFESTLPLSDRTGGAICDALNKRENRMEAGSGHRGETISTDANTEDVIVETQQRLMNVTRKNKKLLVNNNENATACNRLSDPSTASKKVENEKNNHMPYHTTSMSDLEFLQILGVTQTKSVESTLQSNTNILSTLPLGEESTLVLSSSSPTPEDVTSVSVSRQHPIQKIMKPSTDKVSSSTRDQPFFLDYTELDAIPFTKFELEEDFLSEVSQSSQPDGTCTTHKVGNPFKTGPLIKRRSPRISEFNLHSPLNSSQSKYFAAGSKRRLSQQVGAIRSIFQFLKEEAIKPKWPADFDLPELFQNLQKLKQINSLLGQNELELNKSSEKNCPSTKEKLEQINSFLGQNELELNKSLPKNCPSTKEKKVAGLCIRKLNDFEVNVCASQKQPLKTSSETVLTMTDNWQTENAFVNDEAENNEVGLVFDKETNCSRQMDNTVTNIKISFLQNGTQSPSPLSLTNEMYTSPPSPIAHEMTEDKKSMHEAAVCVNYCKTGEALKASSLRSVLGSINLPLNQKLPDLKAPSPLLTTSTPKAVKVKSFSPKMSLVDTLEKSAVLFEGEDQEDIPVTPSCPSTNLIDKNVFKSYDSPNLEKSIDWNSYITCSHNIMNYKRDSSPGILNSASRSKIHLSQLSSAGYSPIQLIEPWKKLDRTPLTPLQILEDKRNENDQSPLVYIPARRLSRSHLSETEPKTFKFSGCFQSCSQDAVISILCGSLLTQNGDPVDYLVSVQATSLTVWTKDDHLGWTTELEWRLPPENHLIEAQLLPVKDRVVIITCGWDGGFLFVSLFQYDSQTQDTKRFNIHVSELLNGIRSPANAIIETVSTTEVLLGVTNDTLHVLGKIDFSADLTNEKTTSFYKQRGQLLGMTTVRGQETTCISLSSSQNITIWNTCYGIAIKSIELPVNVPCLTKLLKARNYQGTILLEALWKVDQGCGGLLIINPLNNIIKMVKTYCVPNSTWRCTQSAKIEMGLVTAISTTGSFCLWQSHNGKLVCHSKSHSTTALSVMKSDQSLFVGEIQGCVHLYKLAL